jgi:hypothetical protein
MSIIRQLGPSGKFRWSKSFALANASAWSPTVFSKRCIAARISGSSSMTNTVAEAEELMPALPPAEAVERKR